MGRKGKRSPLGTVRALAFWIGSLLPGIPRPILAVLAVLAGWAVARLVGDRAPVWLRLVVLGLGTVLALGFLLPMLAA
jgi:hypothetical protein